MDVAAKNIVFNAGTTHPGPKKTRIYQKCRLVDGRMVETQQQIEFNPPRVVEDMFSAYSNIDYHNCLRQGGLQFERRWPTKVWWHRTFATVLAMIVTNAYLAYGVEHPHRVNLNSAKELRLHDFLTIFSHITSYSTRSMIKAETYDEEGAMPMPAEQQSKK